MPIRCEADGSDPSLLADSLLEEDTSGRSEEGSRKSVNVSRDPLLDTQVFSHHKKELTGILYAHAPCDESRIERRHSATVFGTRKGV